MLSHRARSRIEKRYRANGDNGLDLALCESIACLDHLGNYCFTGSKNFTQHRIRSASDHGEPQVRLALCVTVAPKMLDFQTKAGSMDILSPLARYPFSISSNESSTSRADPLNMPGNRESRKARYWSGSERKNLILKNRPEDLDEVASLWNKP
ncbi:hypothetical protein E4U15_002269 [Claviceps sp. LM218 group G6]|nr:hypothetical protein E4U15_002269 [Claviceps sp. LM218 group G6]